jgi:hypothetical protein
VARLTRVGNTPLAGGVLHEVRVGPLTLAAPPDGQGTRGDFRTVRIWLPDKLPPGALNVLIMLDGQNLFLDDHAYGACLPPTSSQQNHGDAALQHTPRRQRASCDCRAYHAVAEHASRPFSQEDGVGTWPQLPQRWPRAKRRRRLPSSASITPACCAA